jgi:hypothetical protein
MSKMMRENRAITARYLESDTVSRGRTIGSASVRAVAGAAVAGGSADQRRRRMVASDRSPSPTVVRRTFSGEIGK